MTQPGPQVSRRLAALFATALLGVLAVIGLAVASLGVVPLIAYAAVVLAVLVLLGRRARALRRPTGHTCSCCTSTVFDPVEVR